MRKKLYLCIPKMDIKIMKRQKETYLEATKTASKRMESFMRYYQLDKPMLRGMGNIADIFATTYELDFIFRNDRDALLSDVKNVGDDMRVALAHFSY
ncbi:MAG: hypothetical protein IJ609_04415 [Paludibacteraceae bacterium]|nr:hypothetical protein [Paludibacteraceae bacterium]MBR1481149.1 hypothetical protein [Paludibacteraceae bacterium]